MRHHRHPAHAAGYSVAMLERRADRRRAWGMVCTLLFLFALTAVGLLVLRDANERVRQLNDPLRAANRAATTRSAWPVAIPLVTGRFFGGVM